MTTEQHKGEHTGLDLLKVGSKDVFTDNISKIGQLFPEVLTEKRDEHGRLRPAIDFEKLKQFLSEEIVDGRESYEFTWVGKREAIAEAGRPTTKTLRPDLDESVDFDKSENIFITGDNLEVLKILQESYLGKIDMIYIDPPYNTGKDFVYSDKFQKTDQELKEEMDLLDEEGRQVVGHTKNEKSSARYHSDWLNMMYPRLRLARNLLKDSGVIFISIDDNEQANLKAICDEIFGEENFVETLIWHSSTGGGIRSKFVNTSHQYILLYTKNIEKLPMLYAPLSEEATKLYNQIDSKGRYRDKDFAWKNSSTNINQRYKITAPDGQIIVPKPGYIVRFIEERFLDELSKGNVTFKETKTGPFVTTTGEQANWNIYIKKYLGDGKGAPVSVLPRTSVGLNNDGTSEIQKMFGERVFEFPKSTKLLTYLFDIVTEKESLVLDFFGGSGTTADAVMQLNAEDGGNRKFILCTLDEEVADKSAAKEAGYETIDQISRERIRRAAAKIQEEHPELIGKQDFGFKAYKLDSSNFKDVSARPDQFIQGELFDSVSNIKEGRSGLDLLFQVMLTWGMELSLAIDSKKVAGAEVFDVDQGSLMACFEDNISEEVIRYIAQEQPLRAVFCDSSFANSADKINVSEIFKELSPNTKVKVV